MRRQWRLGRFWIQKKPGVQRRQASRFLAHCLTWRQEAANHHEFRLSGQSTADPPRRQALQAVVFARAPHKRVTRCAAPRPLFSRDSRTSCRGRSCVPRVVRSVRRCAVTLRRARLAGDLGETYISRLVVIRTLPTRRPIRSTRSRSDLTVTTRPGVVAFHRSRLSRLASPCSDGGASCGATHGANFNREAHT